MVVSKATVIAVVNILISPVPNADNPGPKGIKVPIKPNIGAIRVMKSARSIRFFPCSMSCRLSFALTNAGITENRSPAAIPNS